jgi:hypothetical protein
MRHIAAAIILAALATGADARSRAPNCTYDHSTVGVTPCGSEVPNAPLSNNPRPPGEPVYWSNRVQATRCSAVMINAQFPGRERGPVRATVCAD